MLVSLAYLILRFTFLPFIFRKYCQKKKVTIVVFHNILIEAAKKAFKYYKSKYNVISLNDFISAIYSKDIRKLPDRSLIITLDDGYKENYLLKDILKELNIPITVFLCSELINTNRNIWTNYIKEKKLKKRLKKTSDNIRIESLKSHGFYENKEIQDRFFLDMEEINEIKEFVHFQSHTVSHPILPYCTDKKSYNELLLSKKELEAGIGINITSVAFPNGNYSLRDIENAKKAGYKCALTIDYGFNTINSDPYTLKRIPINDDASIHEIIVKTSGFYDFIKKYILRIKTKGIKKT